MTVAATKSGATTTGTASVVKSRQNSVFFSSQPRRYQVQVQRQGRSNDDMSNFPTARCTMLIRGPCSQGCPEGEADFGDGCVSATDSAAVCPAGQADFGSGCEAATATADVCPADEAKFGDSPTCAAATPTADVCPEGEADFGDGICVPATDSADVCPVGEAQFGLSTTCIAATPAAYACPMGEADFGAGCVAATATVDVCPSGEANFTAVSDGCIDATCAISCTLSDTQCNAGFVCPDGMLVAAECADRRADTIRSTFDENPCVCTALLELARRSTTLRTRLPWNNLGFRQYCQAGGLQVYCETVDGVKVPTRVVANDKGITGALPPSLGLLGSLTTLQLGTNAITSLPTEVGALTGLTHLNLADNALTSVPSEFAALTGLTQLWLNNNQLTGFPTEFRTVDPSTSCYMSGNPGLSCANVGAGTTCCTGELDNFGALSGNNCGANLAGGECHS